MLKGFSVVNPNTAKAKFRHFPAPANLNHPDFDSLMSLAANFILNKPVFSHSARSDNRSLAPENEMNAQCHNPVVRSLHNLKLRSAMGLSNDEIFFLIQED